MELPTIQQIEQKAKEIFKESLVDVKLVNNPEIRHLYLKHNLTGEQIQELQKYYKILFTSIVYKEEQKGILKDAIFVILVTELVSRSGEEIRLNYCKKCGESLDGHNDSWCASLKYPALSEDHDVIKLAEIYNVDLTEANQKVADGGRHGAEEGDIKCEMVGAILLHNKKVSDAIGKTLLEFVKEQLDNWGHESDEIQKVLKDHNNLVVKSSMRVKS